MHVLEGIGVSVPLGGTHATINITGNLTAGPSTPNLDSTLRLVRQLVAHFIQDSFSRCLVRDRKKEDGLQRKLQVLVYSILLSHRKDYIRERSRLRLTELEEVMWHTFILRQHRKYDEGNALDSCLHTLREHGHLEVGSDVRTVMKFLVALKGQGGDPGKEPTLAKITPRTVHTEEKSPGFLPSGPLQYGDTFHQRTEYRPHYMQFPPKIFNHLPASLPLARVSKTGSSPFEVEEMINLSKASPGTGVSSLLMGGHAQAKGEVMGALLQEFSQEVTPDVALSLPELPGNADGYIGLNLALDTAQLTSSPSGLSAVGSDEGYASSRAAASHTPGEEVEDPWESVLEGSPLTKRRTWGTLGHIPLAKEQAFLSEAGTESSHNVWLLYQELWASLGCRSLPPLCVRPAKEVCQDALNLLIGVPSRSFLWCPEQKGFKIQKGLCHPGITPEALRDSLQHLVVCGTLVRRLEMLCAAPRFDTQQILTRGSVFSAFTVAISNVLQVYRGMVLSLGEETLLSRLQERAQHLIKKINFIASLCKISTCLDETEEPSSGLKHSMKSQSYAKDGKHANLPQGLCLLGLLLDHMTITKDRACLLLLVSIFKSSCVPFFRYLEDWIYQGVCSDPSQEFMIEVNSGALLRQDRTYWTSGYTLRSQDSIPVLFREVLQEAFICGKTLNLLRLCSKKHHLVQAGSSSHPAMELCISWEELGHMRYRCEAYAAHMDYLAAHNQVTAQQKAEEERVEKQRLMMVSSNKRELVLQEIESKMQDRRQQVRELKAAQLKDMKEEMLKAELRKQEEKEKEAEEDRKIAEEQEARERKKMEQEKALRNQMEQYFHQRMKNAEHAEALAHWRVQRCLLSAARKEHIQHTTWSPLEESVMSGKIEEAEKAPDGSVTERCSSSSRLLDTSRELQEKPSSPLTDTSNHPYNMNTRSDAQEGNLVNECQFVPLQVEKNEGSIKESPSQEVLSVSDMTASLMSTSSDFVETPYDESLPEFEADPKRPINSEGNIVENKNYACTRSTIESILYDRSDGGYTEKKKQETYQVSVSALKAEATANKLRVLDEEFGMRRKKHDNAEGMMAGQGSGTSPSGETYGSPRSETNVNCNRILREEYGLNSDRREATAVPDTNANFTMMMGIHSAQVECDGNGNTDSSKHIITVDDINANLTSQASTSLDIAPPQVADQCQDANANVSGMTEGSRTVDKDTYKNNITLDASTAQNENNGNGMNQNINEIVLEFKERRAQAAAIKEKILNEYHYHTTTVAKNNMNLLRSKAVPGPAAMKNKQRVLETEYGMTEAESNGLGAAGSYSRQVSSNSTSSFRSCASSDRQTSPSTAFTTPDEERPILIDQDPAPPPCSPQSEASPTSDLTALRTSVVCPVKPYDLENMKLIGKEPLLDITGTALKGQPNTRPASTEAPPPPPSISELSCVPVYFIRSIRMHLMTQSRLVNSSLLSEVLVQESLLEHFSALRALLLLHDAHFARALTLNLFGKLETTTSPATMLIPAELNNILNKSVAESCWSSNPQAENLSFVVTNIPPAFTHTTSVVDCLELRYRVRWPHTLVLDGPVLSCYSRVWGFLASLHHAIWVSDRLFCHTSFLNRQDKEGRFRSSPQFHQLCLYRHNMHHFLLVLQAYVISQIHQISWSKFEKKLRENVTSLDHLYTLHSSLVKSITSRCFLTHNGAAVHKLIRKVFSSMLCFCSQFLTQPWQYQGQTGVMTHPAFSTLESTYQEFQKHALFLHKLLVKVGQRVKTTSHQQEFLLHLDFNRYYTNKEQ